MSRLVLNSVFSYILVFAVTLIVVGLAVGANCSRHVARVSGERRLLACSRRQLADDLPNADAFRRAAETSRQAACAPPESKLRGLFQQLDHALQQAPRAAAIKAAMVETERNLRLRCWNEF